MLILQGVPPLGGVKQRWGRKQAILKLNASISRKLHVGDTSKVTINDQ